MKSYTIQYNGSGACMGAHSYGGNLPDPLPSIATSATYNEIACTPEQAAQPTLWKVENGALVALPPTLAQQAQALIAAGCEIVSAGTPALNGTYSCDDAAQGKLNRMYSLIQRNGGAFPGGLTSLPWPDASGAVHVFPSVTEFLDFEAAIGVFALACEMVKTTGAGSLPTQPVDIP